MEWAEVHIEELTRNSTTLATNGTFETIAPLV